MRRIPVLLILCAVLTVANYLILEKQADLKSQFIQLQQEKSQLTSQIDEMQKQLKNLQESHELYIAVSQDLDERLSRAEEIRRK